jgi:hypothetical protein
VDAGGRAAATSGALALLGTGGAYLALTTDDDNDPRQPKPRTAPAAHCHSRRPASGRGHRRLAPGRASATRPGPPTAGVTANLSKSRSPTTASCRDAAGMGSALNSSPARAEDRGIRVSEQVREPAAVGYRLISKAVVYARMSAALTCVFQVRSRACR